MGACGTIPGARPLATGGMRRRGTPTSQPGFAVESKKAQNSAFRPESRLQRHKLDWSGAGERNPSAILYSLVASSHNKNSASGSKKRKENSTQTPPFPLLLQIATKARFSQAK